ncbi:MAG TPA: carboxylesterase [Xanthomonadaceae bacterium]|nr:carboxylesterase [Xanthomonadaceae bacterium]
MTASPLLDCVEKQTGPAPAWSILWLHGLGADGNDFAPLVPQLVRPGWPALRFVFPHAPVRAVTVNAGMRMRAWYDISGFDLSRREDESGVRQSIVQVEALIAREVERGTPASRIVLAGFSQGGAIALAAGLRREQPLAGLIALSTYLPLAANSIAESTVAARSTPVFMAHGSLDPVVPEMLGRNSRDALLALGMRVEWHSYPMAHQVCPPEVQALTAWLGARFAMC